MTTHPHARTLGCARKAVPFVPAPEMAAGSDTLYSYTLSLDEREKGQWGGARNNKARTSERLTDRQVLDIIAAHFFACSNGRTFLRHWTVHYGKAGIDECDGATFIGKLLQILSKRIRRSGGELTALWIRELASGKGGHVHILLHWTGDFSMHNITPRLIVAAGGVYSNGVSKVARVRRGKVGDALHLVNADAVVRYLLKNSSADMGERLKLTRREQRGEIIGKRWGCTANINRAAREREGFLPSDDFLIAELAKCEVEYIDGSYRVGVAQGSGS